jgi:hypothetical protein
MKLVEVAAEIRDGLPEELEAWVRGQLEPG